MQVRAAQAHAFLAGVGQDLLKVDNGTEARLARLAAAPNGMFYKGRGI